MPKASSAVADQVQSSTFRFNEGPGEIVAALAVYDGPAGYDPKCGVKLSIQRLDSGWNPTDDEPIDEFLSFGAVAKFHPSNATGPDDGDPSDLGEDLDVEGNCVLSVNGDKMDKQAKFAIFCKSLEEAGFKPIYLDGYLPNLVGLKAMFTQMPLPKGADFKGKNDPTCLAIKDKKIAVFPYEKPKAGAGKPAAKAAAKPTVAAPKAAAKPAAAAEAPEVNETAAEKTMEFLSEVAGKKAGQTITRALIKSMAITGLPKIDGMTADLKTACTALIKDMAWLDAAATSLGWEVVADDFTILEE